ncbi:hypothetical protein GQR58_005212 [Nymphon striatum]|nr:hypothetical protein GQR58_005212 [Nymphon striatum]
MKLGPSSVVECVRAVEAGGISDRDDFYWTLHSVLVTRKEDMIVFEQAFKLFWRSRELVEKMIQMFSPQMREDDQREKPNAAENRVSEALFSGQEPEKEFERPELEVDAQFTTSAREVLREKDFAQMTVAEINEAKREMAKMTLPLGLVKTRRYQPINRIAKSDPA